MNYSIIIFYRAPNGCLQYFTGIRNTVTSFNFDGTSTRAPGGNLQIQDYTICFRTEEGKSIHNDKIMVIYEAILPFLRQWYLYVLRLGMCSMAYSQSTLAAGDAFQLMTAGGNGLVIANRSFGYFLILNT